jgi:hypothetical protein
LVLLLILIAPVQGQDFNYTNTNGTITITSYTGPGGAVSIPNTIAGLPVTSIGDWAFFFSNTVTSVVVPDSVTNIGDWTFGGCTSLASVSIGNGVRRIGYAAFNLCSSLTHITIPDSVTDLEDGMYSKGGVGVFYYCTNLSSVTLGNGLTNIGDSAFWFCTGLTNITIPDNVVRVGLHAFESCSSLASAAIGNGVITLDNGAFANCYSLTKVTIGHSITNVGFDAFGGGSLKEVYFRGNAPGADSDAFLETNAIIYYLPGTTGWSPTLGSRPTALWNPQAQSADASFGARQNGFGFNIAGTADIPLVIEASTDLTALSWVPLQSCTLTNGLIYFSDPQWTNYPNRIYRIRSP